MNKNSRQHCSRPFNLTALDGTAFDSRLSFFLRQFLYICWVSSTSFLRGKPCGNPCFLSNFCHNLLMKLLCVQQNGMLSNCFICKQLPTRWNHLLQNADLLKIFATYFSHHLARYKFANETCTGHYETISCQMCVHIAACEYKGTLACPMTTSLWLINHLPTICIHRAAKNIPAA